MVVLALAAESELATALESELPMSPIEANSGTPGWRRALL